MKFNKDSVYYGWNDNVQLAIDSYEDMVELNEEKNDKILKLERSITAKADLIEEMKEDIVMLKEAKENLLSQAKHLSEVNGKLIKERKNMENKLIEANTPWYVKLKNKLSKLSIRNPFYVK